MPAQRLVLVALAVVVVLGMASVIGGPPRPRGEETTPRDPATTVVPGRLVSADVGGRERPTVRARVGDVVALRLTASDGRVAIPELGVEEKTLDGVPTVVRFSAVAPGRFAVRVGDPPRRRVAVVSVRRREPAPATPGPAPRETSPGDQAISAVADGRWG